MKRFILTVAIAAFYAWGAASAPTKLPQSASQQALCTTDSECMKLCPPADAECDGGPQQ